MSEVAIYGLAVAAVGLIVMLYAWQTRGMD